MDKELKGTVYMEKEYVMNKEAVKWTLPACTKLKLNMEKIRGECELTVRCKN